MTARQFSVPRRSRWWVMTRCRGVALMLVLVTVVVAAIVAYSFLAAQGTSIAIARNIRNHAQARYVAESGLELALAYIESNDDWRSEQSHGTWVANQSFGEGTFTIVGEDGRDTDADGDVDGDGDLADDASDLLTLTAIGRVDGASHLVRALVTPVGGVKYEEFSETRSSSDTNSITLPTPVGTSEGDLLIAAVVTDFKKAVTSLAPADGEAWTQISVGVGSQAVTLGVWWKIAGSSEPGTHQFTWGESEECYAWMMRFTCHDPVSPINAVASAESPSSSSPVSPSVSTTVTGTMILRLAGFDGNAVTVDAPGLAGHTAITMDVSGAGPGACSGGAGFARRAAPGPGGEYTFSLGQPEQTYAVTVAIAPNPDGGDDCGYAYNIDWRD